MIQALFFQYVIDPNPWWWPLLYPADIVTGFYLSRIFAARMLAWQVDDPNDLNDYEKSERTFCQTVGALGGVIWIPGLAIWGTVKAINLLKQQWEPSIDANAKKIIEKRSAKKEQPSLGKLEKIA